MARWDDLAIELKCEILRQAVLSVVESCFDALVPNPGLTTIINWKPAKQFAFFRSMLLTCRDFYQLLKFEVKFKGLNAIEYLQAAQFAWGADAILELMSGRRPLYQPEVYPQNLPQRIRDPDTIVLDKQTFVVDGCSTELADAVKRTKRPFFELVQELLGRFWRNPLYEEDFEYVWSILRLEKERHRRPFLIHLEPWILHFSQEFDRCCAIYEIMHMPGRVVEAHAPVYVMESATDCPAISFTLSSRYICLNRAHGTIGTWIFQTVSNIIFPENYVGDTLPGVIGDATEDWWFVQLDQDRLLVRELEGWCFINFHKKLVLNSFDCVLRTFDDREYEAELEQRLL
jgi:hypothetical protein